jgi:hypothetical protein
VLFGRILPRSFYARSTVEVARGLLPMRKTRLKDWTLGAACSGFDLSAVFDTGAQLSLKVCASQGLSQ